MLEEMKATRDPSDRWEVEAAGVAASPVKRSAGSQRDPANRDEYQLQRTHARPEKTLRMQPC